MNRNYIKLFIIFFLNASFFNYSFSESPGTPSSSYNYNYNIKSPINDKIEPEVQILNTNLISDILVQGNRRLDTDLIITESQIREIGTDEKSLSLAVKNLYKTGYFENVQIFKDNSVVFINVKENPVVDLISIEGNKEIADDIILEELSIKSRNVYSVDVVKSDADIIETLYRGQGFFQHTLNQK